MRRILAAVGVVFLAVLLLPLHSKADSFTFNWGEQNGPGDPSVPFTLDAGSYTFAVPAGQSIVDASFSSTLGNSTVPNTAVMNVFVNTVEVGTCAEGDPVCANSTTPVPFTYTFTPSDFSALDTGSVDLSIVQTDCCVIRLGASTLTIDTALTGVKTPEPASLAMLGTGLFGLGAFRKRKWLA